MKKNIKNIILISDYIDINKNWEKFINFFAKENINVINFNWSNLYSNKDNITLDNIKSEIQKFLLNKKINYRDSIIVCKGISCIYVMQDQKNLIFNKCILINPYISNSIINPYTSKIPTYKKTSENYWNKLRKEYYNLSNIFLSINDKKFINDFILYKNNYEFMDKITGYINDFIYLNKIKKNENNYNFSNCLTILSKNNNILNYKKQLNFINKKSNEIILFDQSSHNIEIDKSNEIINLIKKIINN